MMRGVLWVNDKIVHCTNFVQLFVFFFPCFPRRLLLLRHLLLLLFSLPEIDAYSLSFLIPFSLDFLGCTWCYVFFLDIIFIV